ncbi:MAG: type IV pilin protein [Arenicella sp.]
MIIIIRQKGFSLIELMVATAIIAILASIAIPNYQDYIRAARRAEAIEEIGLCAAAQKKRFSITNSFDASTNAGGGICVRGTVPACACNTTSDNGYYNLTIATPSATTFTITATPVGPQAQDTRCTSLFMTNTGFQGYTPTSTVAGECWKQ